MPLPSAGYFVNAFRVSCSGPHTFTRVPLPSRDLRAARRALESQLGRPVWVSGEFGWVTGVVDGGETVEIACDARLDLHHFATRGAIRAAAEAHGMDTWFSFGQLSCADPTSAVRVEPVVVEPVLQIRVGSEGVTEAPTAVVARADSRWRFAMTLRDRSLQEIAHGETATRIEPVGDGPRRGRVVTASDGELVLSRPGRENVSVSPDLYSLVARAPLVQAYVNRTEGRLTSAIALRNLRIATGSLDSSGRLNSYAVKDREQRTADLLDRLGRIIEYPDGVTGTIADNPIEIYVES